MSHVVTAMVQTARLPKDMDRRVERKAILRSLAGYCDDRGRNAFPSKETIGGEAEVGTTMVREDLNALCKAGLIDEQAPPGPHKPRTWCFNLDRLAALIDPSAFRNLWPEMQDAIAAAVRAYRARSTAPGVQHGEPLHASGVHNFAPGVHDREPDPKIVDPSYARSVDVPPTGGVHGRDRARATPRPAMAKSTPSVFFVGTRGRPLQRFLAEQFIATVTRARGCNELEAQAWLQQWCEFTDVDHIDDEADLAESDPIKWWRRRFDTWLKRRPSAAPFSEHQKSKTVGNDAAVDAFVRAHQQRAEEA